MRECSDFDVIRGVGLEHAAQVRLAEHDEVLEALVTNGADEPLNVTVLPRQALARALGRFILRVGFGQLISVAMPQPLFKGTFLVDWREGHRPRSRFRSICFLRVAGGVLGAHT